MECPADAYCLQEQVPSTCPLHTASVSPHATEAACQCVRPGTVARDSGCILCPVDYFCSGHNASKQCPNVTTHPTPGAQHPSQCRYPRGTHWNASSLVLCQSGYYCSGYVGVGPLSCPANSTSEEGSWTFANCSCIAGLYMQQSQCVRCPLGAHCAAGVRVDCPLYQTTLKEGTVSKDMCVCQAGWTRTLGPIEQGVYGCVQCAAGFYCPLGHTLQTEFTAESRSLQLRCPEHHFTLPGASRLADCMLDAGWCMHNDTAIPCPIGHFCPFNNTACHSCPLGHTSPLLSTQLSHCVCPAGTHDMRNASSATLTFDHLLTHPLVLKGDTRVYAFDDTGTYILWTDGSPCVFRYHRQLDISTVHSGDCTLNRERNYSANMSQLHGMIATQDIEFTVFTWSSATQTVEPLQKDPVGCMPCPEGSYCDLVAGTGTQRRCPAHAVSEANASSLGDCTCGAGCYTGNYYTGDSECIQCPENHYCEGGSHMTPCTPPMTAPPQSSEHAQCMMPAGYFGDTLPSACPEQLLSRGVCVGTHSMPTAHNIQTIRCEHRGMQLSRRVLPQLQLGSC